MWAAVAAAVIHRSSPSAKLLELRSETYAMKEQANDSIAKKMYEAPKILTISLRPEEAVLGNCKISGSGGPSSPGSCVALRCSTIGS